MAKNRLSLKLTTLGVCILLASCGGGGSEGYYDTDTTSPTDGSSNIISQQANSLKIELSKLYIAANNDTLTVTVRALDSNKGALEGVDVSLAVNDQTGIVSINGSSTQKTDAEGNAIFVLKTSSASSNIQELIDQGFSVIATSGALKQEQTIAVTGNVDPSVDTTSIVLFETTKSTLNVRGDQTTLTLTAVDANGSVLANQPISLRVVNVAKNGVKYVPQATQTDVNGQIRYTLILSEGARNSNYSAEQFIQDGLSLEANFGQSSTIYKYKVNIINSDVPIPVGAISVAYNPTKIEDSANGVYYYKNVSVQVTDVDGKPIPNQDVIMGVNALVYYKGYFSFVDTSDPADGKPDEYLTGIYFPCKSPIKVVNQGGEAINQLQPVNGQTVQVVSYINSEGTSATDNKYTTDANGRFDLKIQYPKIYASWLTVQLTAKTMVANTQINGSTSLNLTYLIDDVNVSDQIAPNRMSPYGISPSCSSGE
nr:Ig-like domain-containing protein [Acinetobacter sp. Marseille-Q1620]